MNAHIKALEFLKVKSSFQLGDLPTEKPHPKTRNLSNHANNDLNAGIESLKSLDLDLLNTFWNLRDSIRPLLKDISDTILSGGRIFLCGCGATGRLSIVLETLWREVHGNDIFSERVISFMAGGDCALIKSIEKFEDFPEFGARQLMDLNFFENDLLISTTEGGETPFVIGATNKGAEVSKRKPYFLYCNPDDVLTRVALRSKEVIENQKIKKINLTVGPMGLTGSTRMQASSVLMLAVGLGLLYHDQSFDLLENELSDFMKKVRELDFNFLIPFIEKESEIYKRGEYIFYQCDEVYGISIITDTTERSPTFSLYGFENFNDNPIVPCLSYLLFSHTNSSKEGWHALLRRIPRTFKWHDVDFLTDDKRLYGYDFSNELVERRTRYTGTQNHNFKIYKTRGGINLNFDDLIYTIPFSHRFNLYEHLLLKFILNIHSTLVMGRLGRYRNNVMTWVRPSNNKLIDRTVRYISELLNADGVYVEYDELVHRCYEAIEKTNHDESVVDYVYREFLKK